MFLFFNSSSSLFSIKQAFEKKNKLKTIMFKKMQSMKYIIQKNLAEIDDIDRET